jgi:RNA polymerase sigma-70 factor, ECF subfamily
VTTTTLTVERARRGDPHAFEELYREHSGQVYATACRMTADEALAKDVTQEVFIRLWKKIGSFRGESEFTTWFRRLTINVCLNALNSERRREKRVFGADDLDAFDRGTTTRPEHAIDLERAIKTLPTNARAVFVLHDVEGYKHVEIAEMTGVAVGTVKAQLHRARKLLQGQLNK